MAVDKLVGEFGASAKAKLAAGGQPEDQLRAPLENLLHGLAELVGLPAGALVLSGEKSLAELRTRPDYAVEVQRRWSALSKSRHPARARTRAALQPSTTRNSGSG